MTIYRDGLILGTPDQTQVLLNALNDAVAKAANSASAAATSASNAETTYQDFINLYLGAFSTAPTTDNDSSALDGGELYYNTTDQLLYVYDIATSSWKPAIQSGDFKSDGSVPMSGTLQMSGNEIKDYSESKSSPTSSAGTLILDVSDGNIFTVTLSENITTLTISNVPASGAVNVVLVLTQDATGSRTITWPSSVKWAGGTTPTLTTTASAVDILVLTSFDSGTTWYGFISGLDMK